MWKKKNNKAIKKDKSREKIERIKRDKLAKRCRRMNIQPFLGTLLISFRSWLAIPFFIITFFLERLSFYFFFIFFHFTFFRWSAEIVSLSVQ